VSIGTPGGSLQPNHCKKDAKNEHRSHYCWQSAMVSWITDSEGQLRTMTAAYRMHDSCWRVRNYRNDHIPGAKATAGTLQL
jgi:hypothetical protein